MMMIVNAIRGYCLFPFEKNSSIMSHENHLYVQINHIVFNFYLGIIGLISANKTSFINKIFWIFIIKIITVIKWTNFVLHALLIALAISSSKKGWYETEILSLFNSFI